MSSLPSDRTKLNAAVGDQSQSITPASGRKNREALIEAYDTIDLLNQKLITYQTGTRYNVDGGAFTDTAFVNTIDGGTFA